MKTRSRTINRLLSLALCLCMVLAMLPAIPLVAEAAGETITIYFENNWNWANVTIYYWGSKTGTNPGWPGNAMKYYDTSEVDDVKYYSIEIPADVTGIIFSNKGSDQSIDITSGWYDGIAYRMIYRNYRNECDAFKMCEIFPAMHNKVALSGSAATCTKDGLTDGEKCTICNKVVIEQETIAAKGHNFVDDVCSVCGTEQYTIFFQNNWHWTDIYLYYWFDGAEPNPAWPGTKMIYHDSLNEVAYYYLQVPADITGMIINGYDPNPDKVGDEHYQQTPDITTGLYNGITYYMDWDAVNGNKVGTFDINEDFKCVLGHDYKAVVTDPDCENGGYTTYTCSACGENYTDNAVEALGHDYKAVVTDPDCENGGYTTYTCARCGDNYTDNTTEAQGHEIKNVEYIWAEGYSSCTATGTCGVCGKTFSETAASVISELKSANCVGPAYLEFSVGFDAPWAEKQTTEDYDPEKVTNPDVHIYGSHYVNCGDGTHVFICNACSVPVTEYEPHNKNIVLFAGNCQSVAWYRCSVCNFEYSADKNPDIHAAVLIKADNGDGTHTEKWVCCGVATGEAEEHTDENKDGRCDSCHVLIAPVQLIKTSASLEGNIAVNYFMLLSEEVKADQTAYMQFTVAGDEPIQVPISECKSIEEYCVFTCEVNAKEMTDVISSQFYYGGQAAFEKAHEYNVRAYAKHVIGNSNDKKTQTLMKAMVNYGAASQFYFDYNTGDLANTGVTTTPDYSKVNITGFDFERGQGTEKVKLYSASLILNSETTLRLFFNGNITATYQGEALEVKYRGGLYYVDVVGIAAKYLDDDVTITINDGTADAEITFSPLAYCQLVQQDTTGAFGAEMKDLACALYLYNQAANAYFNEDPTEGSNL